MAEAPARTLEFVDVLRQLKRAINKGGKLYNQGDHAGCYKEYLSAAQMICERCVDDEIRKILEKAIKEAEEVGNSTEQAWGLRVAFDLIKDRGRVTLTAAPAAAPAAADKTQAVTDKVGALSVRDDGAGPSGTPEEQARASVVPLLVSSARHTLLPRPAGTSPQAVRRLSTTHAPRHLPAPPTELGDASACRVCSSQRAGAECWACACVGRPRRRRRGST